MALIDRKKAVDTWHLRTFYSALCAIAILCCFVTIVILSWIFVNPVVTVIAAVLFVIIAHLIVRRMLEKHVDEDTLNEEPEGQDLVCIQQIRTLIERRTRMLIPPILVRRTAALNASLVTTFARGDAVIMISSGMMSWANNRTIMISITHELGHYYAWDYYLCETALMLFYGLGSMLSIGERYGTLGQLVVAFISFLLLPICALVALMSRQREYAADAFMAGVMGEVDSFEGLLDGLTSEPNGAQTPLNNLSQPGMILSTYPMNIERVQELRKLERRENSNPC